MSFAWPHLLWLLLAPIGLIVWEWRHRRPTTGAAHPKILRAEAGHASLRFVPTSAASHPDPQRRPRFWLGAGLALSVVALARPQWGRLEEPVFDQSREIILAIDLSRSMLTPDVKPSRLERTKLLIQALLEKLAGERVGLVVFSGTAFLQVPLSADYEILREFLPNLGPEFLPEGGTHYAAMLETTLQAFGATNSADRFLIVLSDGEATDASWRDHLEELKKKNIRVLALGVGTAGGGMIPDGGGGFVKDERGAVVLSKLESGTLQDIARTTGGVYRDASAWIDLAALVNETIEAGRKGDFVEKNTIRLVERFQWPLSFGLWLLLVSFYREFPVRPRPRSIALHVPGKAAARREPNPLTRAAVPLLTFASLLTFPTDPARAAAKLAHPPATATAPVPAPAAASPAPASPADGTAPVAPEPPLLARIVGRLSAAERHTARDWADLGRETVTWGSRLQSQKKPVAEGPVRDALAAVELGENLDAKATDWSKLREELEALLKKPEDDPQQKKDQKDESQEKDPEKDQDKSKQDQQKQDKSDSSAPEDQQQQPQKSDDKSEKDPTSADQNQPNNKDTGESAFGDMNRKDETPPPPPPENMQKVGGTPEKKPDEPREQMDPTLALPMQKLEQLRNQDSPAQLFQLMDGEKKPAKSTGKNW